MEEPRVVVAPNAGLFTLDGTRTFILGRSRVAVIDPGPADPGHAARVAGHVADAEAGVILLTHAHPDHAEGTPALARATGFPVAGNVPGVDQPLSGGSRIPVDDGWLEAVDTPGHARRHLAYLARAGADEAGERASALFVGDLLLGEGETTWIGEYPGCVHDYLDSLDRVEALTPARIYPAHGPALERPAEAVAAFRSHRRRRIEEVERSARELEPEPEVWAEDPGPLLSALIDRVYGPDLPADVRMGAAWSVRAVLEYVGLAPFPPEGPPMGEGRRLAGGSR